MTAAALASGPTAFAATKTVALSCQLQAASFPVESFTITSKMNDYNGLLSSRLYGYRLQIGPLVDRDGSGGATTTLEARKPSPTGELWALFLCSGRFI